MWEAGNECIVEYELGCLRLRAGSHDLGRAIPVWRAAGEQGGCRKTILEMALMKAGFSLCLLQGLFDF